MTAYTIVCFQGESRGLADEVIAKAGSIKKKLVILPHSGHICMQNEPNAFYSEVIKFVEENK